MEPYVDLTWVVEYFFKNQGEQELFTDYEMFTDYEKAVSFSKGEKGAVVKPHFLRSWKLNPSIFYSVDAK